MSPLDELVVWIVLEQIYVLLEARRKVVQTTNLVAKLEDCLAKIGADEPSSARHDNRHDE